MWTIFKAFIEFVTILAYVLFFFFQLWGMWDVPQPGMEPPALSGLEGEISTTRSPGRSLDFYY